MSNVSLVNGHIDRPKMTDEEIPKKKIKAYAHITVGGTIDKPCYSIEWYDVEENSMHSGFSSYNLEFVRKWLNEEFEVVEPNSNGILEQGFKSGFRAGVKAFAHFLIDQTKNGINNICDLPDYVAEMVGDEK